MARAASRTVRNGVRVWYPSGTGFTDIVTSSAEFRVSQFIPREGNICKRHVTAKDFETFRTSKIVEITMTDCYRRMQHGLLKLAMIVLLMIADLGVPLALEQTVTRLDGSTISPGEIDATVTRL